ncbi:fimbrial protein [Kluyvera sichuanensis]|uniref:fimbrial protein n=1 Tax=Kluyvera sichuanensis TaxID=2725494 RepID=UPI002FD24314
MNKLIKIGLLAATISASCGSYAASTEGVQVNFTGQVVTSSCDVSVNGGQSSVDMGNVSTAGLSIGDTTTGIPFTVDISGCPSSVSTAALDFEGTAFSGNNTLFGLTSSTGNTASQIAMVLKNTDNGGIIMPNISSTAKDLTNGAVSIPLTASMKLMSSSVDEGQFTVSTSLHVIYD